METKTAPVTEMEMKIEKLRAVRSAAELGGGLDRIEKQKAKGTYDSPCMSVCNYEGVFKECQTCHLRQAEKNLWPNGDEQLKGTIIRAITRRV